MEVIKKKKITWASFRQALKLYKYLAPYKTEYFIGMLFLLGSSLTNLAFPKLLGDLVNSGNAGTLGTDLNRIALILALLLIVQSVFSYFRVVLFVNVTEKALALLRRDTYNHLIKLPLRFFEKHRVGELNSRISSDISLLQETLTSTLAEFIRQVIIIIGGITLLAMTSIKLTLFMLAILPAAMFAARVFGKFIRKFSKEVQNQVADSNTVVEETLQGIQSVKTFTNEDFEMERYRKRTQEIADLGMKSGKYRGAFSSFIIFGLFGAIVAVIWRGSALLATGELVAGDLFSFVIYSVFVGGTVGGLASVIASIQKFIGATEALFELFDEEEESLEKIVEIPEQQHLQGEISFEDLSFAYPSRENQEVLNRINLTISINQQVALVGPSGAGKSTFASLILQLHQPTEGKILFDGKESSRFPLSVLRSQIALVPQDVFLFGGTIRENIAYGRPNASEDEIYEAAKKANALEFIERFTDKFDTLVGERGTQLSGGQRQRIAIARAVLKNPKILILDEATSSLDSESERLVQDALEKLMKGRTSIVIAHRLSTVRKSDQILVLHQGSIVERGTHEELLRIDQGIYRNLSELQFAV
ncbi:MAG TPA: multidrug ABC transporter ATP-binding protein [Marinilabiliales bacterium]|jgi:ABC-type multidrug transport system fused ATPase/permease subunit|nr:MAG: multidrug ABC transporter ATP-binding protein [Bacteroidetes bacterium GWA2_40_14]OFX60515.1 MAG: multidrug ABC transporter ATP-binding protein [Bacteroidetes bacterium GWC2_40_13]OFX72898.1 MAG: multidrug ABC transporter ATP-binding protein [Bacteroidetes bacterium GWD2_40_43]OFX91569.1 MAG: multidrug ABC transporter ATP-binding protein [Bacteroidetes bacterium GWE2_40_63]OFY19731.1 MAG: multidrug ABC transporter ATP-binding protein [Bacteroidetes bacterium GWF2_40_13]OFZ25428.1 MAG: 